MGETNKRLTEEEKMSAVRCWKRCGSFAKAGKEFGVTGESVKLWASKFGEYSMKDNKKIKLSEEIVSKIREMRSQGIGIRTISSKLMIGREAVRYHVNKMGGSLWSNDVDPFEYVSMYTTKFEYVRGYTGSGGHAVVRCKTCGRETEVSCVTLRQMGDECACKACKEDERKEREERLIAEKESHKKDVKARKEAKKEAIIKAKEEERERKKRIVTCKECGKEFETYSNVPVYCSSECRKRALNCHKDRRISSLIVKDKGITLRKLYNRDNGICYLCGEKCDWNDKKVVDGCVICGRKYPSIEHVHPLSKGGTHSWDNVRLACIGCNTKKGTSIIVDELDNKYECGYFLKD